MTYHFDCNGKDLRVFCWNDEWHTDVSVETEHKSVDKPILKDDAGKYFVWDNTKIYLDKYKSISLKELDSKLHNDEWLTEDDFTQAILHDGIENVRFFVPMHPLEGIAEFVTFTSSTTPEYLIECKIDETRYKVKEGYKITLKAINPAFGWDHYYTCDLFSLIKSGHIFIKTSDKDHVEAFEYEKPIGGGFVIRESGTAIVE